VKCKNLRDCKKHHCQRKCCDGSSCKISVPLLFTINFKIRFYTYLGPTCDQKCNRSLACKNHKCTSRCHIGSCSPCTATKEVFALDSSLCVSRANKITLFQVSCSCGSSRRLVPCGMERHVKAPRCKFRCKKPPDCHHPMRTDHVCHIGDCPPCDQLCETVMKCGHACPKPCHDRVEVVITEGKKVTFNPELLLKTSFSKNIFF